MNSLKSPFHGDCIVSGPLFNEPMRVETVKPNGMDSWIVGLVGIKTEQFRRVTISSHDLEYITVQEAGCTYEGNGRLLKLGLDAYSLGIAWEFDPYFGLSISRVDPLPHQLEAVYDYMLKLAQVRFLLADDAGAGKTIMSGLLIRELKLRGLCERILIVCPANLSFQWKRELWDKFRENFTPLKGTDIREQYGVNEWLEKNQVITSLDLAKREEILPGLKQVHWDLVIIDEAHRMSWSPPSKKTARYALGELLRDTADHMLMLTATPHKGVPANFTLFLQLLDKDVYADVKSIEEAMQKRRAPFYLRRTKEAMFYFPEKDEEGNWKARPIFTKRIPNTADFKIDGDEMTLYKEVTRFVKRNATKAAEAGDDPRARAVGFLMSLYQRRLASSTAALKNSLENRANRLENKLKDAKEMVAHAPPTIPDQEDWEEMEEAEQEKFEKLIEAITMTNNADLIKEEIEELRVLAKQAQKVVDMGCEAKLTKLKNLLKDEGFYEDKNKRLLIFTEFKDTLNYLIECLKDWGFSTGHIHGGMKPGDRDIPGTRIFMEQQFKEGNIQVLVATEAAGEGINLQCCNIMFNYDIPWNPNRLEQRMGRIHRYGQLYPCFIWNFVATNTIEGRVLERLLEKLQSIRDALENDTVFNVVGEVLPPAHIERILREYYAGRLGDADLEDRILKPMDEDKFRSICQTALEGLATKNLNLAMLIERRARAQERRVVPETIARFMKEASDFMPIKITFVEKLRHTFDPSRTPPALRRYEQDDDWKLPPLSNRYPRCSTDRETAEKNRLEWITPGHPLFEAIRRETYTQAIAHFGKGACYYSLSHDQPERLDFYRAKVVDGMGKIVHERLFCLGLTDNGGVRLHEPGILGNMLPVENPPSQLPNLVSVPEATSFLNQNALTEFIETVRKERLEEVERIAAHVELSLTELLGKVDEEIGKAQEDIESKMQGAEGRLAQAEARHAELMARREKRREELARQRSLTLQGIERLTSALILPHPDREKPEMKNLRPDKETEMIAMRVVMEHEQAQGRRVYDVSEKNLGYDVTSLDLNSGDLRLIEVKGIGAESGAVILTPNERRVAEDRRDCYWLYVVTNCKSAPTLKEPIKDPARLDWKEVTKVAHYQLPVNSIKGDHI